MPCNDNYEPVYRDSPKLKTRAHEATIAACELARILREYKGKPLVRLGVSTRTIVWVRNHDAEDAKCIKVEKRKALMAEARETAISKLTPRERKALGV